MTRKQFTMFFKMLSSNLVASVGEYTFKIERRINDLHELNQYYNGTKTCLFAGSIQDCINTAKECISMMYVIEE